MAANGQQKRIFTSIFNGTVTRQQFISAFDGFIDGGTAGLANALDTLTFRHIDAINDWRIAAWDLDDSWLGTASNTAAWVGTLSGYLAAAAWFWTASEQATMGVSL